MNFWLCAILFGLLLLGLYARAASPPTAAEREQIDSRLQQLTHVIEEMRAKRIDDARIADVEIYQKAALWILRFPEEFFTPAFVPNTIQALDHGIARAAGARVILDIDYRPNLWGIGGHAAGARD